MLPPPTILAVASPPGRSARGIVRIAGEQTFPLLKPHLTPRDTTLSPEDFPANTKRGIYRATLQLDQHKLPCLTLIFPKPNSYTGEDSIELQVPGNPTLLQRIIDHLLDDARRRGIDSAAAEPGEFTACAFINGRLSLTQAEGVAATISAQSDAELRAAQLLSTGKLGRFARTLADRLASALALVEAGIDFTDQEDVIPIAPGNLYELLDELLREISSQLNHSVGMEQLEAIPWVVITGPPNAGKSTLFNALLGHERAVVSPAAGTTRDVLAEPLTIETDHGRAEVMLIDLAGADDTETTTNREMQAVARDAINRAELIIHCIAPGDAPGSSRPTDLCIRTKSDLLPPEAPGSLLRVSALTDRGLDTLLSAITDRLADRAVSLAADAIALLPRHEAALSGALRSLGQSLELLQPVRAERSLAEPELIASSMRSALDELAAMAGDITPDDVLGRIFAGFCVGK